MLQEVLYFMLVVAEVDKDKLVQLELLLHAEQVALEVQHLQVVQELLIKVVVEVVTLQVVLLVEPVDLVL